MTTPPPSRWAGTDDLGAAPPGCPAHGLGPGGLRRIHGPEADADLAGLYEKLRAEHGPVAPVLIHNDVPMWVVLGHSENLHMVRTRSQYTRDSRTWRAVQDGSALPTVQSPAVFSPGLSISDVLARECGIRPRESANQTVPTLKFADGSTLTNPSGAEVKAKLAR